jgi:hypothetical protein
MGEGWELMVKKDCQRPGQGEALTCPQPFRGKGWALARCYRAENLRFQLRADARSLTIESDCAGRRPPTSQLTRYGGRVAGRLYPRWMGKLFGMRRTERIGRMPMHARETSAPGWPKRLPTPFYAFYGGGDGKAKVGSGNLPFIFAYFRL